MRAVVCRRLGDPTARFKSPDAALTLVTDEPQQLVGPLDVRIRVVAAALNFADALMVQGKYQEKPPLPFIPGSECSGVVIETGRDVRTLKAGDKVCALSRHALSEEVVVPEHSVIRLSSDLSHERLEEAAGLPITFGTAYLSLVDRAKLQPGQTLLVLGAAGGVGLAAVQLGKVLGAKVIAVARGQAKMATLTSAGADVCIDSASLGKTPLREAIKRAAPKGVDVVLDPVGGQQFFEAFKCVRWGAQILVIGFAASIPQIPANIALVKNTTIHGIYWGSYQTHEPRTFRKSLDDSAALFSKGEVNVYASHRYALEDTPEAFSVLLNRKVIGKLLVMPREKSAL